MKKLTLIILLLGTVKCFSQSDSVLLKVTKIKTEQDTKIFFLSPVLPASDTSTIAITVNEKKNKVKRVLIKDQEFVCVCRSTRQEGETVRIAKKDLVITNPKPTRRSLFN